MKVVQNDRDYDRGFVGVSMRNLIQKASFYHYCPFKFYLQCKSFHWLSGKSGSSCYYIAYVVGGGGWLPWCLHPFGYYPTSHPLFTSCKLPAPINPLFPSLTPDHLHNVEGIIREGKARPNRRR